MEKKLLKDYTVNKAIDIDQVIDDFYNYIYIVIKNSVNITITDEDIEEIISDVFVALWKNYENLNETLDIKAYLVGISKNIIKNRYRKTQLNISISEFEEKIISNYNVEEKIEIIEQEKEIEATLKTLKKTEYNVFILYYYESRSIKEISEILNISISNVKVILHRVRKKIKKNLKDGGYGYGK